MSTKTPPSKAKDALDPDSASFLDIAARDVKRLKSVFAIIVRHGFGELLLRTPLGRRFIKKGDLQEGSPAPEDPLAAAPAAQRFKKLLEALGPTYIKFGQVLSMRPDLLPPDFIATLEGLQDRATVVPFDQIRNMVEHGLGQPLEELFAEFSEKPLASASISQAHLARTKSGEQVVVKVQRPGIGEVMRGDLDLLFIVAKILETSIEEVQIMAPSEAVAEFEKALIRELNFSEELANLLTAQQFLAPDRALVVPRPYPELSCRTVMTMEFFEGKALRHLTPESDRATFAVTEVLHASFKQVLLDGFFHGDPHAGNILINEDDQICLIDLGLVGRLTETQRANLVNFIVALITRDVSSMARLLLKMGTPTQRVNLGELKQVITHMLDKYFGAEGATLDDVDTRDLTNEFIAAAHHFKIKLASEYVVLAKASMTVEGIVRQLAPRIDLKPIVWPYVEQIMVRRFSPKSLLSESVGGVLGLSNLIKQLPTQFEQILHDAETGNIQIRAVTPDLDLIPPLLHQVGGRLALSAFAASMTMGAALLLSGVETPSWYDFRLYLGGLCLVSAGGAWVTLLWWHVIGRGRPLRVRTFLQFFRR